MGISTERVLAIRHPITKTILFLSAIGVMSAYVLSSGVTIRAASDGDKLTWSVETKAIDWQPIAAATVLLAAIHTGRIDWIIDAAERRVNGMVKPSVQDQEEG